jgi:hypothetical protein
MNLEKFKSLEAHFYRAPSAHNTQPWRLHYAADSVKLNYDLSRTLPISDPTHRDLFLSLGAFVETVLIVCADAEMPVAFNPTREIQSHNIVGEFLEASALYQTKFTLADVQKRQTSRHQYQPVDVMPIVETLKADLPDGIHLHLLQPADVLDLYIASDSYMYHESGIAEELYQWLRLDKKDARYYQDGLNADCLVLSPLEAKLLNFVLHPKRLWLLRNTPLLRILLHFSADILRDSSRVLALSSHYETMADMFNLGRALQRLWLKLAQADYYTHPLSQIIDCPHTKRQLAGQLDLQQGEQLFSIFRFGQSDTPPCSHRINR